MNRLGMMLLFASGVLLGLSRYLHTDYAAGMADMAPMYAVGIFLAVVPLAVVRGMRRKRVERLAKALEVQNIASMRNEFKAKIPKGLPRRDSKAAYEGSTKVGTARSMAALIRKPGLRETTLELCDFADMILETIRRMPTDTPAAVTFTDKHLSKLTEALEHCFERSRSAGGAASPSSFADAQEMECFNTFIAAFKRQQDYILFEGLKVK